MFVLRNTQHRIVGMRNLAGEIVLNIPAGRAWQIYRDDEIISTVNPEMLANAKYLEGDGSPGSLRFFKLGPDVSGHVKESIQKIEEVEMERRTVTYSVIGGELQGMYDPYRVTFSFTPIQGEENEKCIAKWEAEYEPLTLDTPPPAKARDAALNFLKWFDKKKGMRNLAGEIVLNIPAERAWQIYRDDEIISTVNPEMLAHVKYLEGDGSPGSLRLFKLGPDVSGHVKESIQKIEEVEKELRTVTYSVIGGELKEMYDPYRVTFSFTPIQGEENEKCIAKWKAEYEPLTVDTPPPAKARDAALNFLKWFDNILI